MEIPKNCILGKMNQWTLITFALIGFIVGYGVNGVIGSASCATTEVKRPAAAAPNVPSTPTPSAPRQIAIPIANAADADDDAFMGDADAPITLIEFTDYQCPYCARHNTQTMSQFKTAFIDTGKVKYVSRDFPLGFHENAQKAAEAGECAGDQNKFWEMHDKMFENQKQLDVDSLKTFATDLGLNAATFNTCLDSGKYEEEVKKDAEDGKASGITGTPGFVLYNEKTKEGFKISGALPFATFKQIIEEQLEK